MSFKKLKNATKENRPGSKVDCEEIPIQLREMASPGNGESTIMRFDCAQGKDVFIQGINGFSLRYVFGGMSVPKRYSA